MREKLGAKGNRLQKALGLAFGIAVVIGGTIGAGILRTPGSIAALLPNAALILTCWIAIGLYIILSASQYAELTTMLPKAGGAYNYIKRAFGNYAGFINGWFDFFTNAMAPAYFCIVLSEFAGLLLPALTAYKTPIALGILTFFAAINLPGIKGGSIIQQATSAIKIVLFLILIGACFIIGPNTHSIATATPGRVMQGGLFIALFRAMQLMMGTFDGWMAVSYLAEEDKNPAKNIPRSYLIGALSVALLYVLINAALLYVLPVGAIAQAPLAAANAASVVFNKWGASFITVFSIFAVLSILNTYILVPPRILYGLSRDGFFIKAGIRVNKGGTPAVALLCCYAFAFVLIMATSFEQLFALGVLMMTAVTLFAFFSLLRLRRREPQLPRPYKAWGYPFTTWLTILVTMALFIGFAVGDPVNFGIVVAITALSYPCYKLLVKIKVSQLTTKTETAVQS